MRRTGLVAAMVTGGALAAAGAAHAGSDAQGRAAGSPGLISGNTVQVPVHTPVNVCGNTVNVVGLLNPAAGNNCANEGNATDGATAADSGAVAAAQAEDSPGLISGNAVQLPVDVPVNVTGNSVNVVGIGNAAVGNSSSNSANPPTRTRPVAPPSEARPATRDPEPQQGPARLAETGTPSALGLTIPVGAALLLGGALLYRRARAVA
ncbi:chaplin [Streptomyces pacificus]|uniref:Chaplin n=2 Tax=Streptomyces pacificus TaxID=2705029 RepID=A0A6A0AQI4_9ACTN|nr:chaplin [Streptomyces pacificus]